MYHRKAHIHFVGIGGIGMSGIATILHGQGYTISGCDRDLDQPSIQLLKGLGCTVYHGNNRTECHDTRIDILVYSSAIQQDNPEIIAAQQRGIPTIPRALMLAELMRTKYSVAIAGSHGKTTTTSLIAHILLESKLDPTIIIGGHLKTISTNARIGNGDFLVAEADESDRSLLHLQATLAVLTNIDFEHVETYKDLDDVKQTFRQFLENLPFYGKAFVCIDDPNIRSLLPISHIKTIRYGLDSADADLYATQVILQADYSLFMVHQRGTLLGQARCTMPGVHNVRNTLAAIAVALDLDVPFDTIAAALQTFKGIARRFSYRGTYRGAELFDDYGHHPNEITHTLTVTKKRAKKRAIVLFQPHRFTRTQVLWNEFIDAFMAHPVDHLIITDIYPAGEAPIDGITSKQFVAALKKRNPTFPVTYTPYDANFTQIKQQITPLLQPDDLFLLLGAGKLNNPAIKLAQE